MFEYWFMFPIGIAISSIAIMTGIGGAILFSPFFLIVLKLEPLTALAAGLFIEMFGFASGVIGYWREKLIDFTFVKKILLITVPFTIIGVFFGRLIPIFVLKIVLIVLLGYLTFQLLFGERNNDPRHPAHIIGKAHPQVIREIPVGQKSFIGLGGLLIGMVSAGLGEVNEFVFLRNLKMSPAKAAANSVFLVAVSAFVGIVAHTIGFAVTNEWHVFTDVLELVAFTIPGVIIGAQIGIHFAKRVDENIMGKLVGFLFLAIAIILSLSFFM